MGLPAVQRNRKISETLLEEAKHKLEEAMRLAKEFEEAKEAAIAAAKVLRMAYVNSIHPTVSVDALLDPDNDPVDQLGGCGRREKSLG